MEKKKSEQKLTKDMVESMFETPFIKVYDIQYAEGRHYYDATRRNMDDLVAIKPEEEFQKMLPDAVGCCIILIEEGKEPRLLLVREFRYPIGRFILSPTSGIIDQRDLSEADPLVAAAKREIAEETGLSIKDGDRVFVANPLLFTSPATLDESCALVCAVLHVTGEEQLSTEKAEGSELFDGFCLLTKKDVQNVLSRGRDEFGNYYSIFTWVVMMYFLSNEWR